MRRISTITMRRISTKRAKLHVEAPACIVNITPNLITMDNKEVTSIEIICDQYAGEQHWTLPDHPKAKTGMNVRVVRESEAEMQARIAKERS